VSGLAGGAAGAVAGGVGASEIDSSPDNLEIAYASAIGWLVGGAVGLGVGYLACPPEPEAAPEPPPPAPAPTPAPKRKIVLRGVFFDFDAASLRADARPVLDEADRALREDPAIKVQIEGHTDSVGSDAYNQRLSERRARTVAEDLGAHGIAPTRLTVSGRGEAAPVSSNDTAEGRAQNRRVELRVVE
jgi:OOP family OmpA-OmpF porin